MPEILTESFCERCGTRYTFESAAPRAAKLKGIRVLSRGLKNFVMSDDSSMDEAMAAARSETDREQTSQQLDAFHKTFNFCMTCRQYTCGNCWNEAEGRCLTCAPHLGHEILPAPFPEVAARGPMGLVNGTNGGHPTNGSATVDGTNGHGAVDGTDALAWPTMDLEREEAIGIEEIDAAARLAAIGAYGDGPPLVGADDARDTVDTTTEVERSIESVAVSDGPVEAVTSVDGTLDAALTDESPPEAASEPAAATSEPTDVQEPDTGFVAATDGVVASAAPALAPAPLAPSPAAIDPADVPGRAAAAAAQTTDLLRRFRPGQSLDAELEAYERAQEVAASLPDEARPNVTEVPEAPAASGQPEAPEASVAADAESVAAASESVAADGPDRVDEPVEAAAPEGPPMPREDVVTQPTWRIVAPDAPAAPHVPTSDQPAAPETISAGAEPQWPTQPEWPSQRPASGLAFLGRPALPTGGLDSLWAESAREVTAPTAPLAIGGAPARGASGGVQPCVSCGLSLSATARFCRRCGTPQG